MTSPIANAEFLCAKINIRVGHIASAVVTLIKSGHRILSTRCARESFLDRHADSTIRNVLRND